MSTSKILTSKQMRLDISKDDSSEKASILPQKYSEIATRAYSHFLVMFSEKYNTHKTNKNLLAIDVVPHSSLMKLSDVR